MMLFKKHPTNSVVPPSGRKLNYQQNGGKNLGTTSALTLTVTWMVTVTRVGTMWLLSGAGYHGSLLIRPVQWLKVKQVTAQVSPTAYLKTLKPSNFKNIRIA
jgi:hypothetical protein